MTLPASQGRPYRVSMVCLGNICRSPIAEAVLRDALAALGNASRLVPGSAEFRAALGHASALAGKADRARQILDELETLRAERYVSAVLSAEVAALPQPDGSMLSMPMQPRL